MKVIKLSDNTGDKVRDARVRRESDFNVRLSEHAAAVAALDSARKAKRAAVSTAWGSRRFGKLIAALVAVIVDVFSSRPAAPRMAAATDQERVWAAGNDGEEDALGVLGSRLDDSWTAIVGYRNRKGECDILLVGSCGLLGIEIKNVNGVIHADGDVWTRDKLDRYGNVVERNVPITDRGGRSPARQVNEVCDSLLDFLSKRNNYAPTLRAVVLTHSRGRVGLVRNPTVQFFGSAADLDVKGLLDGYGMTSPINSSEVVRLIQQDHAHHNSAARRTSHRATSRA